MNTELCYWCQKKYPSEYYFVRGTPSWKRICRECFVALSPADRQRLLDRPATAEPEPDGPEETRECLRCRRAMVKGDLAYLVEAMTQIRQVRWVTARRAGSLLYPEEGWTVDREQTLAAWRCGSCGHVELVTPPDDAPALEDAGPGTPGGPPSRDKDDPTVL
jgi:hypothetical protein